MDGQPFQFWSAAPGQLCNITQAKATGENLPAPKGGGRGLAGLALPHSVAVGGGDE